MTKDSYTGSEELVPQISHIFNEKYRFVLKQFSLDVLP